MDRPATIHSRFIVRRRHYILLAVVLLGAQVLLSRVIYLPGPFWLWVVALGVAAVFWPREGLAVWPKHWVLCGVLLLVQLFGFMMTVSRGSIHVPALLWPAVLVYAASGSFITALILITFVGAVSEKKGRPHGTP